MDICDLTMNLCRISSLTGREHQVCQWLADYLQGQGFCVRKVWVERDAGRFNVLALPNKQDHVRVLFCSHLDTVPPFIAPKMHHERKEIWGRGSLDAKGIVASMVGAAQSLRSQNKVDFALLFVVGEETDSDGAKAAQKELSGFADFVVCGEPTELKMATFQKGSLLFELSSLGKEAHSSLPHLGDSAIHTLLKDCQRLLEHPWPKSEAMGETFLNIGQIQGGSAANALAASAQCQIMMRLICEPDLILETIRHLISAKSQIKVLSASSPIGLFVLKGWPNFVAGFGSDVAHVQKIGRPLLFGPGNLALAHGPDEHISVEQLEKAAEAYEKIYDQLQNERS